MTSNRVVSKNLFNYVPKGDMDEDIRKSILYINFLNVLKMSAGVIMYLTHSFINRFIYKLDFKIPGQKGIEAALLITKGTILNKDEDFVKGFRILCNFGLRSMLSHPVYDKAVLECDHSEIKVPTSHLGDHEVPVLVHAPKELASSNARPAIIYAHGGGVVGCSASTHKPYLSKLALKCKSVIFNVDYRRAPEARCPNNILDFYETLKYVIDNANDLRIDTSRIAISGESGGGYICLGTMVLLSQRNESSLVKLAMPIIPMVDDDSFKKENTFGVINMMMRWVWRLIATDFEQQKNSPLLFPGKSSDQVLENMPPTIIWEAEYDIFKTEASRLANKLKSTGRLLEFVVFPGQRHGSWMNPRYKCHEPNFDAFALAAEKYLIE